MYLKYAEFLMIIDLLEFPNDLPNDLI